jgi:hypothetical protein
VLLLLLLTFLFFLLSSSYTPPTCLPIYLPSPLILSSLILHYSYTPTPPKHDLDPAAFPPVQRAAVHPARSRLLKSVLANLFQPVIHGPRFVLLHLYFLWL